MEILRYDLRFSLRTLIRRPAFSVIAVLTLALGVGANSAVFSFVNALLLRPMPFPEIDRLVTVRESSTRQSFKLPMVSPGDFLDWRQRSENFERLVSYGLYDFSLDARGDQVGIFGAQVSAGFLNVLHVSPVRGRAFLDTEEDAGQNRVALISHRLWTQHFGADPDLVGKPITIDGGSYAVVGIMGSDFEFPFPGVDLWLPMAFNDADRHNRREHFLLTVGRLKPGITIDRARAELEKIGRELEREFPQTNTGRGVTVASLSDQQSQIAGPFLILLQLAAMLVLLIACVNVASLQLGQSVNRRMETALRTALGASRWRLMRLLMVESLVLAAVGAVVGSLLAMWGVSALKAAIPPATAAFIMGWDRVTVDWRVLLFTMAVAVAAGITFGFLSARQASKLNLTGALKDGGSAGQSSGVVGLRHAIVLAEVALAMVTLIAAGQAIKGFQEMFAVNQGYSPDDVLTMRLLLPKRDYSRPIQVASFYERALRSIGALPGVRQAAAVSNLPGGFRYNFSTDFDLESSPPAQPGQPPLADLQFATADFFPTLRIPVVAGRTFGMQDSLESLPVAVVSAGLARRYWPDGQSPLGGKLRVTAEGPQAPWRTVVGVVGDVRQNWFEPELSPVLYLPHAQAPREQMYLLIRCTGNPMLLAPAVRAAIRGAGANLSPFEAKPMRQVVDEALAGLRFAAWLMGLFAAIALALSALGVYGVMASAVAQRRREFGIRIALGASPGEVHRMVIRQGLARVFAGIVLGLAGGIAVTRLMSGLLYGLSAVSILVFAGVPLLLSISGFVACYVPAHAATRVDPITTLRQE